MIFLLLQNIQPTRIKQKKKPIERIIIKGTNCNITLLIPIDKFYNQFFFNSLRYLS